MAYNRKWSQRLQDFVIGAVAMASYTSWVLSSNKIVADSSSSRSGGIGGIPSMVMRHLTVPLLGLVFLSSDFAGGILWGSFIALRGIVSGWCGKGIRGGSYVAAFDGQDEGIKSGEGDDKVAAPTADVASTQVTSDNATLCKQESYIDSNLSRSSSLGDGGDEKYHEIHSEREEREGDDGDDNDDDDDDDDDHPERATEILVHNISHSDVVVSLRAFCDAGEATELAEGPPRATLSAEWDLYIADAGGNVSLV